MNLRDVGAATALAVLLSAMPLHAQSFGMAKIKVTLDRKLPALTHLPANTIQVNVTTVAGPGADVARDLGAQLAAELLHDDSQLQQVTANPAVIITGQVTNYAPPQRSTVKGAAPAADVLASRGQVATANYQRVTGSLNLAFQVKTSDGTNVISDNIAVSYDQEFLVAVQNSSSGSSTSSVMGNVAGSAVNMFHRHSSSSGSGSSGDDESKPPTDPELRQKLMAMAVKQMAAHVVNTDESIEVYLAKDKSFDDGDKDAVAGLWERALETFETAQPLPKKEDDAYRLYNIGVADEALGYQAQDPKAAMKLLDDAAIQYGKAIDARPDEKYFLEPQKRIETAIEHYRKLQQEQVASATPPPAPAPAPAPTPAPAPAADAHGVQPAAVGASAGAGKPLTNQQVIAMVRAGMDDGTVAQTVKNAKAINFDLTPTGRKHLTDSGVDATVISAMKARAIQDLNVSQ
jgi:hypothetical protein